MSKDAFSHSRREFLRQTGAATGVVATVGVSGVPVDQIERIEIVRGPRPLIFGSMSSAVRRSLSGGVLTDNYLDMLPGIAYRIGITQPMESGRYRVGAVLPIRAHV